jgi:hypothetical protein
LPEHQRREVKQIEARQHALGVREQHLHALLEAPFHPHLALLGLDRRVQHGGFDLALGEQLHQPCRHIAAAGMLYVASLLKRGSRCW